MAEEVEVTDEDKRARDQYFRVSSDPKTRLAEHFARHRIQSNATQAEELARLREVINRIEAGCDARLTPGMKGYISRAGIRGIIDSAKHKALTTTAREDGHG